MDEIYKELNRTMGALQYEVAPEIVRDVYERMKKCIDEAYVRGLRAAGVEVNWPPTDSPAGSAESEGHPNEQ